MTFLLYFQIFKMLSSDSDSDDSVPLKRVSSLTTVPSDMDFKVKVKQLGSKTEKFLYTLKKGLVLPYTTNFEGVSKKITFSKSLQMEIDGVTLDKVKEYWIIVEDGTVHIL